MFTMQAYISNDHYISEKHRTMYFLSLNLGAIYVILKQNKDQV